MEKRRENGLIAKKALTCENEGQFEAGGITVAKSTTLWMVTDATAAGQGDPRSNLEDDVARVRGRFADVEVRLVDSKAAVDESSDTLRRGRLVAFPTETVYGLGASALDPEALAAIFAAKGRPRDNPLIAHVADIAQVCQLAAAWPRAAQVLMERYWPGPLSILLSARDDLPRILTAGLPTVAVRMPDHALALGLIRQAGVPIAAPSANRSGRPSPTTAWHVLEDLAGVVAGVMDGGPCAVGIESTVVDVTDDVVTILRPGAVSREDLLETGFSVAYDPYLEQAHAHASMKPRSPGQKYRHYAPRATLRVFVGKSAETVPRALQAACREARAAGLRTAVLTLGGALDEPADFVLALSGSGRSDELAKRLYAALRQCDEQGMDLILAQGLPPEGGSLAVMNRLLKAAGGNVQFD